MADSFHFEKQFLKFVLIFLMFCEFSDPSALNSDIKKENLKGKNANMTVSQLCRRPPNYIPLFILEMYRKIATKKGISANTKLTIRSIPGKSKCRENIIYISQLHDFNNILKRSTIYKIFL